MKTNKMRVYVPDWNTDFIPQLPVQRAAADGEPSYPVRIVPLPYTKINPKKEGVK